MAKASNQQGKAVLMVKGKKTTEVVTSVDSYMMLIILELISRLKSFTWKFE